VILVVVRLVKRFVTGKFWEDYLMTVGVNIGVKRLSIGAEPVSLVIWDLWESSF